MNVLLRVAKQNTPVQVVYLTWNPAWPIPDYNDSFRFQGETYQVVDVLYNINFVQNTMEITISIETPYKGILND